MKYDITPHNIIIRVMAEHFDSLTRSCLWVRGGDGTGQYISPDCPLARALRAHGYEVTMISGNGAWINDARYNSPMNNSIGVEAIRERLLSGDTHIEVVFTKIY